MGTDVYEGLLEDVDFEFLYDITDESPQFARTGMEAVRASNMDFDDEFKPFIRDGAACSFAYYAANRDRHLIHP